jgi:hypothetical protein
MTQVTQFNSEFDESLTKSEPPIYYFSAEHTTHTLKVIERQTRHKERERERERGRERSRSSAPGLCHASLWTEKHTR